MAEKTIYIFLVFSFLTLFSFFIKNFYFHKFRYISLLLLFFSLGIFAHFLKMQKPKIPDLQGKEFIYFKITKKLNSNEKNKRYEVAAWSNKEFFQSVLSMPKEEKDLDFQHYYKGEAYINKIQKPYSDFQFDYGKYLARKYIYFQCYLPNSYQSAKRNDLIPSWFNERQSPLSLPSRTFTYLWSIPSVFITSITSGTSFL